MQQYANMYSYSDVEPYEIIRHISEKTIEVRAMKATLDPTWKPNFIPGGFAAHCTNQSEQRWIYESDLSRPIVRVRLNKKGWRGSAGKFKLADKPRKFHDYNF